MEITREAEMETVEGPEEYFTGKATITGQFARPAPLERDGRHRVFRTRRADCMAFPSALPDADRNKVSDDE